MSAKTKIAWTDSTWNLLMFISPSQIANRRNWLKVDQFMAVLAERYAVRHSKPQVRMIRERLDVMCLEVAAFLVSASLTGVSVAGIYGIAPCAVLHGAAIALVALVLAVAIGIVQFATRCSLSRGLCNFIPYRLRTMFSFQWTRPTFALLTHPLAVSFRPSATLKWRRSRISHPCSSEFFSFSARPIPTQGARSVQTVRSAPIETEVCQRFPFAAAIAELQAFSAVLCIFLGRASSFTGSSFDCTSGCLCHCCIPVG